MPLHVTALHSNVILELSLGRVEGIADRDVYILVLVVPGAITTDGDLLARHPELDANGVQIAPVVMLVQEGHRHVAARDPFAETLKLRRSLPNPSFDGLGSFNPVIRDSQRLLHSASLLWVNHRGDCKRRASRPACCRRRGVPGSAWRHAGPPSGLRVGAQFLQPPTQNAARDRPQTR
jgi:hypothetical protein